jgi:hypothetical protein
VVQPRRVVWPTSRPFETPSTPAGTVIDTDTLAASDGWSFDGNQVAATSGCPTASAPSSVWKKPDAPSSSCRVCGTPS